MAEGGRRGGPAGRAVDWLLRDRTTGRWVVGQWPNLPLLVFLAARALEWAGGALSSSAAPETAGEALHWVGTGALVWWAADEVLRGVNPFRRMLGAVVAVVAVLGIVTG